MLQKTFWFSTAVVALLTAAPLSAEAQYVDFTPRDKAVEVDTDILDNLPSNGRRHDRAIDCTTPAIAPVTQMPLQLTEPEPMMQPSVMSEPPAPSPESVMRTYPSAPVPTVDASPADEPSATTTKPASRVLKPLARGADEPFSGEMTSADVTNSASSQTTAIALPTPKPENYPSYMTQPGQISTPSGAALDRVPLPAHRPENIPAGDNDTPISLMPEDQPLPVQKPTAAEPEKLPDMPEGIVETSPVLNQQEETVMPTQNVTEQIEKDDAATSEETATPPIEEAKEEVPASETEYAAVPTIADLSIEFQGNDSNLDADAQSKLKNIIEQMTSMDQARLQVRAYATGEDGSKSSARRISLSRALAVRSFLMDNGIKPTRVDVRALGTETDRSPIDRVDLVFAR